jgi:hypothetical protein
MFKDSQTFHISAQAHTIETQTELINNVSNFFPKRTPSSAAAEITASPESTSL